MIRVVGRLAALVAMLLSGSAMAETYTPNAEFFAPKTFSFETTRGVTNAPTVWGAGTYHRSAGDGALGYFLYHDSSMAVHPSGTGPYSVILKFRAPRAGPYRFSGGVSVVDKENGTGVGVTWTGSPRQVVKRTGPDALISTTIDMAAGQQFVLEIDSDGTSAYDTTGLSLSVEGPDAPTSWNAGAWSDWSTTCGMATRSRTVDCRNLETGEKIGDASCVAAQRPQASETSQQTSGCTFAWQAADWSAIVPSCGSTVQTRGVECRRSDGVAAADASCTAARPEDSRSVSDFSACTFGWQAGEWSVPAAACGTSTRTRPVSCARSDGATVDDASCAAMPRPSATEEVGDLSGCTYRWVQTGMGDWSTCIDGSQTRPVQSECHRSDGMKVSESNCPSGTRPADDARTCTIPVVTPPPGTGTTPDAGTGGSGSGTPGGQIIFRRSLPTGR